MATAWSYFRSTPIGELITGTAHDSHPADLTTPIGQRFAGQTVIGVHIALDRAATVRVAFDASGAPRLSGIRNVKKRSTAEFADVLRSEAAATNAKWAIVVLATEWQAVLGQRAARSEQGEAGNAFARHRIMFETPEVVVPRAQVDRVYTAIDHPVLDKSIVFSVRRRDLEDIFSELRRSGLGVAAVKIAVAAQLETWLATEGENGLSRDILVSDGLSALLVNTAERDFVPPHGAIEAEQPRQAVQRPSAIEEDLTRFILANTGRSMTFLGPEELCAAAKKAIGEAEVIRQPNHPAHEVQIAALGPAVRHDLNFDARETRPALPRTWRRPLAVVMVVAVGLALLAVVNTIYAVRTGYASYQLERDAAHRTLAADADAGTVRKISGDFSAASELKSWVAANYHAQKLCYRLLREIPPNAALDKLLIEQRDGQLALTFVVLGDQETQLSTHRAIEGAIKELRYKIGGEEMPTASAGTSRSVQYRLHLIVPDAAEAASAS